MAKSGSIENYYDILEVQPDCTDKEIRTAYVELSKKASEYKCLLNNRLENFLVSVLFLVSS